MTTEQTPGERSPTRHAVRCTLLAATVYLGLALLVLAPVLPAPSRLLPYLAVLDAPGKRGRMAQLDHSDQQMVVAVVTRNAALLTSRPWRILRDGQCHPLPRGYTLGEHMLGLGILAAVPWSLTGDPIVAFNVALLLTLWIAGVSMYLLARHFTGSAAAAFVGGLLFELAPRRITGVSHPYVHGDCWTPLALLFLHRVFVRGRWSDAVACAAFTTLALGESLYPLVALAILVAVYLPYLCVRHRARLRRALPRLALCGAWLLMVAWLIFGPYLETRATWDVLSGRTPTLVGIRTYLPGRLGFPGFLTAALVVVALVDRMRGARRVAGEDPRLAYLVGALLIVVATLEPLTSPGFGVRLPSPLAVAQRWIPGLDAVRALPAVGIGVGLPLAFLAAYGAHAVLEHTSSRTRPVVLACAVGLVLAGRFVPALARPAFGLRSLALAAFDARPPEEDIELVRTSARGAVLDVPFPWTGTRRLGMAKDLLRVAYGSPRPTAACYNSFVTPVQRQVGDLATALPAHDAADALAALGFETVLLEKDQMLPPERRRFVLALRAQADDERRLAHLGETDTLSAYRLASASPVARDFALLAAGVDAETGGGDAGAAPPPAAGTLTVRFRNGGAATFRHPDPIAPSELVVRWATPTGDPVREERVRALLPIALGAGGAMDVPLALTPPTAAGRWLVTVARAADPGMVLGRGDVAVGPEPAPTPAQSR